MLLKDLEIIFKGDLFVSLQSTVHSKVKKGVIA